MGADTHPTQLTHVLCVAMPNVTLIKMQQNAKTLQENAEHGSARSLARLSLKISKDADPKNLTQTQFSIGLGCLYPLSLVYPDRPRSYSFATLMNA